MNGIARSTVALLLLVAMPILVAFGSPPRQEAKFDATRTELRELLDRGLYAEAEAFGRARFDSVRSLYPANSLEVAEASDLLTTTLLMNGRGASAITRALAEESLRTKEVQLGSTHPALAITLLNLGGALLDTADYPRAVSVLERALALYERNGRAETIEAARVLGSAWNRLCQSWPNNDGLRVLERSQRIKESMLDRDRR